MAIYSGFTHTKWWFSIVMLVYQTVLKLPWLLLKRFDPRIQKKTKAPKFNSHLAGGAITILKNMKVKWEGWHPIYYGKIKILWKNKKCSKPPTRLCLLSSERCFFSANSNHLRQSSRQCCSNPIWWWPRCQSSLPRADRPTPERSVAWWLPWRSDFVLLGGLKNHLISLYSTLKKDMEFGEIRF